MNFQHFQTGHKKRYSLLGWILRFLVKSVGVKNFIDFLQGNPIDFLQGYMDQAHETLDTFSLNPSAENEEPCNQLKYPRQKLKSKNDSVLTT